LDGAALLFGLALAALTVLLCGLFPALKFSVAGVGAALRAASTKSTGDQRQRRARHFLIALETALATALLIVAGLMLRTVFALTHTDPGFRTERVLTLNFARLHELEPAARARYYGEVLRAVQAVPGVSAAALNDYILLQNEDDYEGFRLADRPTPPPGTGPREEWRRISPDYFRVLGVPLLNGRLFAETDNEAAPSVVIINQALARKYWPNENPVGRRIRITQSAYEWSEIVGLVGDMREVGLDKPAKPMLFVPYQRAPRPVMGLFVQLPRRPNACCHNFNAPSGQLTLPNPFSM
jgi:putative ABC transport system permease protein